MFDVSIADVTFTFDVSTGDATFVFDVSTADATFTFDASAAGIMAGVGTGRGKAGVTFLLFRLPSAARLGAGRFAAAAADGCGHSAGDAVRAARPFLIRTTGTVLSLDLADGATATHTGRCVSSFASTVVIATRLSVLDTAECLVSSLALLRHRSTNHATCRHWLATAGGVSRCGPVVVVAHSF